MSIIKLPHKKLIYALILAKYNKNAIDSFLRKWKFPTLSSQQFLALFNELLQHDPDLKNPKTLANMDAVKHFDVFDMYAYIKADQDFGIDTIHIKDAFTLLEIDEVKNTFFVLSLLDFELSEIELLLTDKYYLTVSSKTFELFQHYFFNLKDFSLSDRRRLESTFSFDVDTKYYFSMAFSQPRDYVLWKLNLLPQRSVNTMLKEMLNDAFFLFKEKKVDSPDQAINYGNLAVKLADRIAKFEQPKLDKNDEELNKLVEFEVEEEEDFKPPTNDELGIEIEAWDTGDTLPPISNPKTTPQKPVDLDDLE